MYDELFAKVPDHPRLQNRDNEATIKRNNSSKIALLRGLLDNEKVALEFAPGDCNFSYKLCNHSGHVIGVDISDQRKNKNESPGNFSLVIYDGYDLGEISDNSIDLVFSDQLLEHFHVEDTRLHLETVMRILKPGGIYLFRTPHAYNGPHDVSKYFSNVSEGFHLKEWTFAELKDLLKIIGYSDVYAVWNAKNIKIKFPFFYFSIIEAILVIMPAGIKRRVSRYLLPTIAMAAVK
jgi:SAM-dependent methyltransferase